MAPGTISSSGCICIVFAIWIRIGTTSVVVALLDVNSVIVPLIRQIAGAMAK